MPKDPKKNIESYQVKGGDLNEFEFAKNQSEIVEESQLPFNDETRGPNQTQAEHVAEVTPRPTGRSRSENHLSANLEADRIMPRVGGRLRQKPESQRRPPNERRSVLL